MPKDELTPLQRLKLLEEVSKSQNLVLQQLRGANRELGNILAALISLIGNDKVDAEIGRLEDQRIKDAADRVTAKCDEAVATGKNSVLEAIVPGSLFLYETQDAAGVPTQPYRVFARFEHLAPEERPGVLGKRPGDVLKEDEFGKCVVVMVLGPVPEVSSAPPAAPPQGETEAA